MRLQKKFTDEVVTEQHHKDDCNVNNIMARFRKTGAIDHVKEHGGNYRECDSLSYHESLTIVANAQSMFNDLPSHLRKKFNNKPSEFLDFVQNPDNEAEMGKLGLLRTETPMRLPLEKPGEKTKEPEKAKQKTDEKSEAAS